MIVSRSVHIDAPVDTVFALVTDPRRRAELNPNAHPLAVRVEDEQPLHIGSRCHYRLQVGDRIVDFRTRIAELEPNRRVVALAEAETLITIEVQTEPEGDGTRLAQSETFEPTVSMLETALPRPETGFVGLVENLLADGDEVLEHRSRQEAALQSTLQENLGRWLEAIKIELETGGRI